MLQAVMMGYLSDEYNLSDEDAAFADSDSGACWCCVVTSLGKSVMLSGWFLHGPLATSLPRVACSC